MRISVYKPQDKVAIKFDEHFTETPITGVGTLIEQINTARVEAIDEEFSNWANSPWLVAFHPDDSNADPTLLVLSEHTFIRPI